MLANLEALAAIQYYLQGIYVKIEWTQLKPSSSTTNNTRLFKSFWSCFDCLHTLSHCFVWLLPTNFLALFPHTPSKLLWEMLLMSYHNQLDNTQAPQIGRAYSTHTINHDYTRQADWVQIPSYNSKMSTHWEQMTVWTSLQTFWPE